MGINYILGGNSNVEVVGRWLVKYGWCRAIERGSQSIKKSNVPKNGLLVFTTWPLFFMIPVPFSLHFPRERLSQS